MNHKRAERLMARTASLAPRQTTSYAPPLPAMLAPGQDDLVQGEDWMYMASILDLGTRRLARCTLADHMRTELISPALERPATYLAAWGGGSCIPI